MIGTTKIIETRPLDAEKLTLFPTHHTVDFVADGITGDAEFYSDDDEDAEPVPPRRPQAARSAPQNPSPENEPNSPNSSEEVSHTTTRSTATLAIPRVPVTNGRRQSTRLAVAAAQQSQQPSPPTPSGQNNFDIAPRSQPMTTSQPHSVSLSDDSPLSPTDRFIVQDDFIPTPIHPPLTLTAEDRAAHPNIYTEKSVFPLQDKRQAVLLRHFVQNLAIWVSLRWCY